MAFLVGAWHLRESEVDQLQQRSLVAGLLGATLEQGQKGTKDAAIQRSSVESRAQCRRRSVLITNPQLIDEMALQLR